jgi:hypothetical protein
MALEMIIEPKGMAERGAAGTMRRTRRRPRVPPVATTSEAAAIARAPGTLRARAPDVMVAVTIMTAMTRGVSAPRPAKT